MLFLKISLLALVLIVLSILSIAAVTLVRKGAQYDREFEDDEEGFLLHPLGHGPKL
jgi:hypothetical protein